MPEHETTLYQVVPNAREKEVQAQLSRPVRLSAVSALVKRLVQMLHQFTY
jgi:type II restriction enzyme